MRNQQTQVSRGGVQQLPLVASLELANAISWLTVIEVMDIVGEAVVTLGPQLFLVVAEIPERVSTARGSYRRGTRHANRTRS